MAGALVVLPHAQRGAPQGLGLLALQRAAFELLGHVGGDDLEDPPAEDAQLLGVVVRGQVDQMPLRGDPLLGGHGDRCRCGAAGPAPRRSRGTARRSPRRRPWRSTGRRGARGVGRGAGPSGRRGAPAGSPPRPSPPRSGRRCARSPRSARHRPAAAASTQRAAPHPGPARPTQSACPPGSSTAAALPASPSRRPVSRRANSATGCCWWSSCRLLLMGEFKHRALTGHPL